MNSEKILKISKNEIDFQKTLKKFNYEKIP